MYSVSATPGLPPTGLVPVEWRLLHKKGWHKPRSTGASPVGTTDGASQVLVHKPPLHRGKPGGGGGGHRAVEKGRVRLQQTTQEETRLNADPGHRGVDGNAPRKTDGVV